jgi:N-acyl-D-aspartate/D-glutamate deacylase
LEGKSICDIAELQDKGIIDAFLDLVVEAHLDTIFLQGENNVDKEAVTNILNHHSAIVGLSDGGVHVQFHGGY